MSLQESMSRCIQKSIYIPISLNTFLSSFFSLKYILSLPYSTYRNTMIASVNCLILGEKSKNNFNVVVGEVYVNDDKAFDQFTVSNFKELLFRRNIVQNAVKDPVRMDLYKVELDLSNLKDKIYTIDEINHLGVMMESMFEFKEYFNNDEKKPKSKHLHIFIVPTATGKCLLTFYLSNKKFAVTKYRFCLMSLFFFCLHAPHL